MPEDGSEAAQSDEEESAGTAEVDFPNPMQETHLEGPAWMPCREIEDDEESIRELHEDRYGHGLVEEDHESSLSPVHRVGIYTVPATQLNPGTIPTAASTTAEVLVQNQQIQQHQQNQQNRLTIFNPPQIGIDGETASDSSGSATAACRTGQIGPRISNPIPFGVNLVFDPAMLKQR